MRIETCGQGEAHGNHLDHRSNPFREGNDVKEATGKERKEEIRERKRRNESLKVVPSTLLRMVPFFVLVSKTPKSFTKLKRDG